MSAVAEETKAEGEALRRQAEAAEKLQPLRDAEAERAAVLHRLSVERDALEREEARAISAVELTTAEPVTVVLSTGGWVRAAKGHDVDPVNLNYKAGDEFLSAARGKSTHPAIFFDTKGKSYSLLAHTLASARGHGEPLTGKLTPANGAKFLSVVMGLSDQKLLLASDAGYGFVTNIANMVTKNTKGKAMLTVPKGCEPLI